MGLKIFDSLEGLFNYTKNSFNNSLEELAEDIVDKIVEEASMQGLHSDGLASRAVYPYKVNKWENSVEIEYKNELLPLPVGSDYETWRHTSPAEDHPYNLLAIVVNGDGGFMPRFGGFNNPTMYPRDFLYWVDESDIVKRAREKGIGVGLPIV